MATAANFVDRATQKQVIVYTGKALGYLDARELVRDKGGLPSNVLHDDILVRSDDWKQLMTQNYYGAWAREVLVYPKKDGEFKKGRDVVDAFKDDKGREWIFPAHSIPEVAIGRKGIGLFVDPQEIEVKDKKAVVLARPESIVVLENFIQNNGEIGKVNEATRIPLSVEKSESQDLTDDQRRWLWRVNGAGVRPLVRGYVFEDALDDIRIVHADGYHAGEFGVGWASTNLEQDKPSQAVAQAPNWLSALRGEAEAAEPVLSALHNIISQDDLQKLERLVRRAKEQA